MTASNNPSNGDVLSAASLLLAILAVLFSLWYGDIAAALRIETPTHLEDAGPQRRQIAEAIKTRAAPLAGAALVLLLVFVPEAIRLASQWFPPCLRPRGLARRSQLRLSRALDRRRRRLSRAAHDLHALARR